MLKEISFNSYSLFGITSTSRRLQFKGSTPLDKYPSNPPFGLRLATSTVVSARAADDLSELQAKFADLTITTARDDIKITKDVISLTQNNVYENCVN